MRSLRRPARPSATLRRLYLLNATVLIAHEIDSAFWREWELFGLPGGIQLFVALHLVVVAIVLYGAQTITLGRSSGVAFAWLLAAGGLFAAVVHSVFLLQGGAAFRAPVSILLLVASAVLSVAMVVALIGLRRAR